MSLINRSQFLDKNFTSKLSKLEYQTVYAYAHTKSTQSIVVHPISIEDCIQIIDHAQKRNLSICNRGAGYSNFDVILNDGHVILDLSKMNKIIINIINQRPILICSIRFIIWQGTCPVVRKICGFYTCYISISNPKLYI